jgi:hypothetical protein
MYSYILHKYGVFVSQISARVMAHAIINIFVPMNIHRWWQQQHINIITSAAVVAVEVVCRRKGSTRTAVIAFPV